MFGRWRRAGLWSNPDFVKLWTGQTISKFGSMVTGNALPLTAILMLAAKPTQVGLLSAIEGVAVLLFGLLAGVWVDRLYRRPILITTDLGRALVLSSIPAAALLGLLHIEQLYIVAALAGILTVFFDVADRSFLPSLVRREHLVEGNSKLEAGGSIAEIGGPPLAGLLIQLFTAPLAILFDAISFLFSALFVGLIRAPEPPLVTPKQGKSIWHEITEGLRVVSGNPLLRALAGSSGTFNLFGQFFATLYGLYLIRTLGVTPAILGMLIGIGGIGALIGAFVVSRVTRRFGLGRTLIGSLTFATSLQLLVPLVGGPLVVTVPVLAVVQLVGDIAIAMFLISEVSLRQAITPDRLLGRVNASTNFLVIGVGPFGALLAGALGELIGMRLTLVVGVIGGMLASSWMFFSPVRRLREQPTQEVETNPVG